MDTESNDLKNPKKTKLFQFFLILILASMTRFSETVYLPSLQLIAKEFQIKFFLVEFTSSLFFGAIAIGNIFWGLISDFIGKKKAIFSGMLIYILGSWLCGFAENIYMLNFAKFIQGIGASCGIILAQILTREIDNQTYRTRVFATLFGIITFIPAIGPILGNLISSHFNWRYNFYLMIFVGVIVIIFNFFNQNTKIIKSQTTSSLLEIFKNIITDPKILIISFIVGGCNGIMFNYFSEGTFYMINILNFNQNYYNLSHFLIAFSAFFGGRLINQLNNNFLSKEIIGIGIKGASFSVMLLLLSAILKKYEVINDFLIGLMTILCMCGFIFNTGLILPNCLTIVLSDYTKNVGFATSIFGFMYYIVMTFCSFGMAILRSEEVTIMPLYFLIIMLFMNIMYLKMKNYKT